MMLRDLQRVESARIDVPKLFDGRPNKRWNTAEFYVYFLVVGSAVAFLAWNGHLLTSDFARGPRSDAGASSLHNYRAGIGLRGIRDGWLPGFKMDLSDYQWREFRERVPLLCAVACAHLSLSWLLRLMLPLTICRWAKATLAIGFVAFLHGTSLVFLLALSLANFLLSRFAAGYSIAPATIWAFNLSTMIAVRTFDGFHLADLSPMLAWLDVHRGVFRYHVCYNMVVLRMISYAVDQHWHRVGRGLARANTADAISPDRLTYKSRTLELQPEESFSLAFYLEYLFYPPLYLAGPILTFNAFASQMRRPQTTYTMPGILQYIVRLLASCLALEVLNHAIHANAIATSGVWRIAQLSSTEVGVTSFWVLNFMWLKFLVIWRFFRSWALLDGVETPENISRCVNNNYDIEGFWRNWHSSFNRWLVRYMYIPLGGSRFKAVNIWAIFTFVAVWHDVELRLLVWAWVSCLFAGPEILAKWIAHCPAVRPWKDSWQFRHTCAVAAAINIVVLMAANLVGFVVGLEGVHHFALQLMSGNGVAFIPCALITFFCAAQLMSEIELEREYALARAVARGDTNAAGLKYPDPSERSIKYR